MSTLDPEVQGRIRELKAEGLGYRAVAKEIGVSEGAVRYFLEHEKPIVVQPYVAYVWDIETTDLRADIGNLMVSSFLDLSSGYTDSRTVHSFEGTLRSREAQLAQWTLDKITGADAVIGHNVKAFDRNFLSGVCARQGLAQPPKRTYIDTMLIARYGLKGKIGASMANLADVLEISGPDGEPIAKDKPSKNDWREYIAGDPEAMERITVRCEADVYVNALLWERLKGYWYEWKGER